MFCCDAHSANKHTHTQAQSRANAEDEHISRAAKKGEREDTQEKKEVWVNCLVWEKGTIVDKGPPQISTHSFIHEQDVRIRVN